MGGISSCRLDRSWKGEGREVQGQDSKHSGVKGSSSGA